MSMQQRVDTVLIAVPQAVDSVTVRVASLPDTVQAVVRQVGGEWYFWGTLLLTAVLIGVTFWASFRTLALQRRNTELQRELNDMQARHEGERRTAERQRDEDHRRAVDARISGIAYALRRQLKSWLEEAPDEVVGLVQVTDAWYSTDLEPADTDISGAPLTPEMLRVATQWASQRSSGPGVDHAEQRMLDLVAAAPEASGPVAEAIRRAYVLFYRATGRLSTQLLVSDVAGEPHEKEISAAYHDLKACVSALEPAIGTELREAERALSRSHEESRHQHPEPEA